MNYLLVTKHSGYFLAQVFNMAIDNPIKSRLTLLLSAQIYKLSPRVNATGTAGEQAQELEFGAGQIESGTLDADTFSFFIHADQRGQGFGKALKREQNDILRAQGFNFATCTTASTNTRQHRVLESCGWKRLAQFQNSATGSDTVLWGWEVSA